MIYRIKELTPMSCYRLRVVFDDGKTVIYDVKEDIDTIPRFQATTIYTRFVPKYSVRSKPHLCLLER